MAMKSPTEVSRKTCSKLWESKAQSRLKPDLGLRTTRWCLRKITTDLTTLLEDRHTTQKVEPKQTMLLITTLEKVNNSSNREARTNSQIETWTDLSTIRVHIIMLANKKILAEKVTM